MCMLKTIYLFVFITTFCLIQESLCGEERFILRSFSSWEEKAAELGPVFLPLRNPNPDWGKIHSLAVNLSREGADNSSKVNLAKYFIILSERALKQKFDKPFVSEKIDTLNVICENLKKNSAQELGGLLSDIVQTIQFEISCYKHFLGKDEEAIKDLTLLLKKFPQASIAPDAVKEMAELFIERKDFNRGISLFQTIARKADKYPALHFEAFYQSSVLEILMVKKSPRALWYCQEAVKGVTDEILIQRGKTRLDDLEKLQKAKN